MSVVIDPLIVAAVKLGDDTLKILNEELAVSDAAEAMQEVLLQEREHAERERTALEARLKAYQEMRAKGLRDLGSYTQSLLDNPEKSEEQKQFAFEAANFIEEIRYQEQRLEEAAKMARQNEHAIQVANDASLIESWNEQTRDDLSTLEEEGVTLHRAAQAAQDEYDASQRDTFEQQQQLKEHQELLQAQKAALDRLDTVNIPEAQANVEKYTQKLQRGEAELEKLLSKFHDYPNLGKIRKLFARASKVKDTDIQQLAEINRALHDELNLALQKHREALDSRDELEQQIQQLEETISQEEDALWAQNGDLTQATLETARCAQQDAEKQEEIEEQRLSGYEEQKNVVMETLLAKTTDELRTLYTNGVTALDTAREQLEADLAARDRMAERRATLQQGVDTDGISSDRMAEVLEVEEQLTAIDGAITTSRRDAEKRASDLRHALEQLIENAESSDDDALKNASAYLKNTQAAIKRAEETLKLAKQDRESAGVDLALAEQQRERREILESDRENQAENLTTVAALQGLHPRDDKEQIDSLRKDPKIQATFITLNERYEKLKQAGASMEELEAYWKPYPESLWPPRFDEELKNWYKMKDQLQQEIREEQTNAERAQEALLNLTGDVMGIAGLAADAASIAGLAAGTPKFDSFVSGIEMALTSFAMAQTATEIAMENNEAVDPVDQQLNDLKLQKALQELVKSGIDIGTALVPILNQLGKFIEFSEHVKEAAQRTQAASGDQELAKEAARSGNSLEGAFKQSRDQESKRAKEETALATASALEMSGELAMQIGVLLAAADHGATEAVGISLVVTGKTVRYGTNIVVKVESWAHAAKCKDLLKRAQGGDEQAQIEIFRHSALYAKGIIAIMAREKDPLALSYIQSRNLTEDMIDQSSPEIIRKYLRYVADEEDDALTFTESIKRPIDDIVTLSSLGVKAVKAGYQKLEAAFQGDAALYEWDKIGDLPPPISQINVAIDAIHGFQSDIQKLEAGTDEYERCSALIEEYRDKLQQIRVDVQHSVTELNNMRRYLERMRTESERIRNETPVPDGEAPSPEVQRAMKNIALIDKNLPMVDAEIKKYWSFLDVLAQV
ncbi:MAG: hypothetical protein AAFV53_00185 [Myxococcota bacterium]